MTHTKPISQEVARKALEALNEGEQHGCTDRFYALRQEALALHAKESEPDSAEVAAQQLAARGNWGDSWLQEGIDIIRAAYAAHDEKRAEREREQREAVQAAVSEWASVWDCSEYPGHGKMDGVISNLRRTFNLEGTRG